MTFHLAIYKLWSVSAFFFFTSVCLSNAFFTHALLPWPFLNITEQKGMWDRTPTSAVSEISQFFLNLAVP